MGHFTIALSEKSIKKKLEKLRDTTFYEGTEMYNSQYFSAECTYAAKLDGGTINLQNNNNGIDDDQDGIHVDEIDVLFSTLILRFKFDLPEFDIGSFSIPSLDRHDYKIPPIPIFSKSPDIEFEVDLSGILNAEISGLFKPKVIPIQNPLRPEGMSHLDAEAAGLQDKYRLFLDTIWCELDFIDIPDTLGRTFNIAIRKAVKEMQSELPDWFIDMLEVNLDTLNDVIVDVLEIGDNFEEWLANFLEESIGLDSIAEDISYEYQIESPLLEFNNPYTILPASEELIPVVLPIQNVGLEYTDEEIILSLTIEEIF